MSGAGGPWDKVFKKLNASLASALGDASKIINAQEARFLKLADHVTGNTSRIEEAKQVIAECEERVNAVVKKLGNIDAKFEEQARIFDGKMEEQHKVIGEEIVAHGTELMVQVDKKLQTITGGMKAAQDKIKKLDKGLNESNNKVKLVINKVEKNKQAVKDLDSRVGKELKKMEGFVVDETKKIETAFLNFKEEQTSKCEEISTKLQDFVFQTDNALARKADIEDLKQKMDRKDFVEWREMADGKIAGAEQKVVACEESVVAEAGERQALGDKTTENFQSAHAERDELRGMIQEINNKKDAENDLDNKLHQLQMHFGAQIHELEDRILKKFGQMAQGGGGARNAPALSSLSGSCFSCGSPVGLGGFGAMPEPRILSPDHGAGGGFAPRQSPKKHRQRSLSQAGRRMMEEQASPSKMKQSATFGDIRRSSQPTLQDIEGGHNKHKVNVASNPDHIIPAHCPDSPSRSDYNRTNRGISLAPGVTQTPSPTRSRSNLHAEA